MTTKHYDLCIIGGGVNGAGIARDAAGRGLKTLLLESHDLAGATSSASTKLIHGGLRYLEYYEFRLVAEALKEREILLAIAPHLVHPATFVLPHDQHLRPAWMIRAGLFLYDHLGGGLHKLTRSHGINLKKHPYGTPLKSTYSKGFTYADCRVDDFRLVALNALDAAERSATILTRTACTNLRVENTHWHITTQNTKNETSTHTATMLVNAAGPWVHEILNQSNLVTPQTPNVRLVKGSHILVPRQFDGPQCYILQQPDHRIIFALPYEHDYTMIGTTDENYKGDPRHVEISEAESTYLIAAYNRSFQTQLTLSDIKHTWSGVRPLLDDGHDSASSVTRDYKLITDFSHGPTLLSVFGGKITTYRHLAEEAVNELTTAKPWTSTTPLPGGDLPNGDFNTYLNSQIARYPWAPADLITRYTSQYGTRTDILLKGATSLASLGQNLGDNLYEAEIRYLIRFEWARTAEDILWRRTKLKLHISPQTTENLTRLLPTFL